MDKAPHAPAHSGHQGHFNPYLLGAAGLLSGIVLAPYVLPALGIGTYGSTAAMAEMLEGSAYFTEEGAVYHGMGLAGAVRGAIASLPLVGSVLTSEAEIMLPVLGWTMTTGVLATLGTIGVLAIGGAMLSNWLQKKEGGSEQVKWSKIIEYAALGTSALIALPQILGAISLSVVTLAQALGGNEWLGSAMHAMWNSLGAPVMDHGSAAASLASMLVPHLATCGAAIAPLFAGVALSRADAIAAIPDTKISAIVHSHSITAASAGHALA